MMKKGKNNMKTSMSWDGWQEKEEQDDDDDDDDDDDEELEDERFFEPMNRISSVVPINLENDEEFDDFDDSRMSFASTMPAPHRLSSATISDDAMISDLEMSHYDVWMAEPGSIKERRMRLLEGMGLCGNNTELVKLASNIELCSKGTVDDSNSLLKAAAEKPKSTAPLTMDNKNKALSSPLIVITRSKSDAAEGNSKRHRCQELLGSSSPPPLARRTPSAPSSLCHCHGESLVRGSATHMSGRFRPSPSNNSTFFCKIKNLDTGKEFIVNEDGTWNCLSDLETGQQLTMEEFERCVGYSPIVKELMHRENVKTDRSIGKGNPHPNIPPLKSFKSPTTKKRGGWLKNIKGVANSVSGLIITDSYSSSPASSSMERSNRNSEWMKVRHHGKPYKELTGLYMCQEIHAHQGSIWSIRFSPDAGYLASAGEDRTIHVWQVIEGEPPLLSALEEPNFTPARTIATANASLERPPLADGYPSERKRRGKVSYSTRKSTIPDYVVLPDTIFSLSDKPICSFQGHQDDVLDISWSKSSELLLSSSMDKTVRLWDMKSKSCLKLFAHNDYVTCIQFNPVDERYFISGSLDAKVRIWSIPDRQVVDWNDLHEMVTAACYTPDGQGALVGSHTGSCRLYSTSDCKLRQKGQIEIQNKKKKSHAKKITGFQFAPGSSSEVLITSADSQIRIFDGVDLIHKFRGFRNTSSQIAASFTGDGKYVVCASEDSQVYIWKREEPRSIGSNSGGGGGGGKSKGNHVTTRSHEHFQCRDVSLAIPWPGSSKNELPPMLSRSKRYNHQHLGRRPGSQHASLENVFMSSRNHCPPLPRKASFSEGSSNIPEDSDQMLANPSRSDSSIGSSTSFSSTFRSANNSSSSLSSHAPSSSLSWRWSDANSSSSSSIQVPTAWGLAIVTAGLGGEIRVYQNFGLPI